VQESFGVNEYLVKANSSYNIGERDDCTTSRRETIFQLYVEVSYRLVSVGGGGSALSLPD